MHKNTIFEQAKSCRLPVKEVRNLSRSEEKKDAAASYDENLKGTFFSTLFIGAFVLISWFAIFYIYITTI